MKIFFDKFVSVYLFFIFIIVPRSFINTRSPSKTHVYDESANYMRYLRDFILSEGKEYMNFQLAQQGMQPNNANDIFMILQRSLDVPKP